MSGTSNPSSNSPSTIRSIDEVLKMLVYQISSAPTNSKYKHDAKEHAKAAIERLITEREQIMLEYAQGVYDTNTRENAEHILEIAIRHRAELRAAPDQEEEHRS